MEQDSQPQPAGATEADDWDPWVSQSLDAVAEALGAAVVPLAQALQDAGRAAIAATEGLVAFQESHAALLAFLERSGVQANWAQDRDMLEAAQALQDRYSPEGHADGHKGPTDH